MAKTKYVYLVTTGEYESYRIVRVFSSRYRAKQYVARKKKEFDDSPFNHFSPDLHIERRALNEEYQEGWE